MSAVLLLEGRVIGIVSGKVFVGLDTELFVHAMEFITMLCPVAWPNSIDIFPVEFNIGFVHTYPGVAKQLPVAIDDEPPKTPK